MATTRSSGAPPARVRLATDAGETACTVPRQPAWAAASRRCRGSKSTTGRQSAVEMQRGRPARAVASASACPASPPWSTSITAGPCTWRR